MMIRKFRLFMNFEKEEDWINEMSKKGLQLIQYKFGRYYFEEGTPGEYIYRIEMLDDTPKSEKTNDYLNFMEENGVEMVASYNTWVYFRKKADDGPFEIFSDLPSRVKHYEKIARVFGVVSLINIAIACINLSLSTFNMYLSILNFAAALLLFIPYMTISNKIKKLKLEKEIFDK